MNGNQEDLEILQDILEFDDSPPPGVGRVQKNFQFIVPGKGSSYLFYCPYEFHLASLDCFDEHIGQCRGSYLEYLMYRKQSLEIVTCKYNSAHRNFRPEAIMHGVYCPDKEPRQSSTERTETDKTNSNWKHQSVFDGKRNGALEQLLETLLQLDDEDAENEELESKLGIQQPPRGTENRDKYLVETSDKKQDETKSSRIHAYAVKSEKEKVNSQQKISKHAELSSEEKTESQVHVRHEDEESNYTLETSENKPMMHNGSQFQKSPCPFGRGKLKLSRSPVCENQSSSVQRPHAQIVSAAVINESCENYVKEKQNLSEMCSKNQTGAKCVTHPAPILSSLNDATSTSESIGIKDVLFFPKSRNILAGSKQEIKQKQDELTKNCMNNKGEEENRNPLCSSSTSNSKGRGRGLFATTSNRNF